MKNLVFIALLLSLSTQSILNSGGVETSPTQVNLVSTLTIYAELKSQIPELGLIRVIFPLDINKPPQNLGCPMISPLSVTLPCTTTIIAGGFIQVTATVPSQVKGFIAFSIPGFTNPNSTAMTDSFQLQTLTASGTTIIDQQTNSINLQATAATLQRVTLTPSSMYVGDAASNLTVTLTTTNLLSQDSKIGVTFPYWNPQAQTTIYSTYSYLNSPNAVTCLPNSGSPLSQSLTCTFNSVTQTLTLANPFSTAVPSGTVLSFIIVGVKNPISTQAVSNILVFTFGNTAKQGVIDQANGTLSVSLAGKIVTSSAVPSVTLVQQLTQYVIQFAVPVPLSAGCIIEIVFPAQIVLNAKLTLVEALGMPNAIRSLTGQKDTTTNSYIISDGCPSYRDNTNTAILQFNSLVNPFYQIQTGTIEIYISDAGQRLVCSTYGQGPTITTTTGDMVVGSLVSEITTQINQITNLIFTLQPLQMLTANSQIKITLAPEFNLNLTCKYIGISQNMHQTTQSCLYSIAGGSKSIIINNALNSDYTPSSNIQFKVFGIQLPPSEGPSGIFKFEVATFSNNAYYTVDNHSSTDMLESTRAVLGGCVVIPSDLTSGDITSYTFNILIVNPILKNGFIIITLPAELSMPYPSQQQCSGALNFPTLPGVTPQCTFNQSSITINNGFQASAYSNPVVPLSIEIFGIQNPRSLSTSSSFSIQTYDSRGYTIEQKGDQMAVTMLNSPFIRSALVSPSVQVVGAIGSYLFTIQTTTPLVDSDVILLTFPSDFNIPIINTLQSCTGLTGMVSAMTCKANGPYSLQIQGGFLSQTTSFSFRVVGVQNPPSTQKSSLFQVSIVDSSGALINSNDPSLTFFFVQMLQPAMFKSISLINQSRQSFAMTAFTFTFVSNQPIPINAQIIISYPSQITANSAFTGCQLSNQYIATKCTFKTDINQVTIQNVTNVPIGSGSIMQVTLYGLITSQLAAKTDSFQFLLQTSNGDKIAQSLSGYLFVTNDCDYPCITCLPTQPSMCLTCDTTSVFKLFLNNQCITTCPNNYYSSGYQCLQCDPNCMECSDGGSTCLKCFQGAYLQGTTCVNQCLAGVQYQNDIYQTCDPCQPPCNTCTTSTYTCSSCLQTNALKYLYQNKCLQSCPVGKTVLQGGLCANCVDNCNTCTGLPSVCTSCNSSKVLDTVDSVCKDSCPIGTTVQVANKCIACDPTCATCSTTDIISCQSCQSGLILYQTQSQCLSTCPNQTVMTVESQVQYCRDCTTGCLECQNTPGYCTLCDAQHVFFNFTCVDACPALYHQISSDRNICVLDREDCTYGYNYNDFGICSLIAQVCEKGYVLNGSLNRCIPVPGIYIPFIFLAAAIVWTCYAYYQFKRGLIADGYLLLTQLITVYSTIQTFTYYVMFCLSIALAYGLVTAVHLTTLISMMLTNLGFGLYMHLKIRKQDQAFQYWTDQTKRPYTVIRWFTYLYSFKSSRLVYSQLLQKPYLNAPFEDLYHTMVRPLFFATVANFLLQVGPIVLMDAYNLMFIPWGYQIMVMSIDNMVLAIVIFILEILEFTQFKKRAIDDGKLIYNGGGKQFLKVNRDGNVFGAAADGERGGYDESNSMMNLKDPAGLNIDEIQAIESMYMTRQGFKKQMMNRQNLVEEDLYKPSHKYLDADQTFNVQKYSGGRFSHAVVDNKSSEAKILENIVKRLNEENKFNQLYSEPASDTGNNDDLLDPETKALMGKTDTMQLMNQASKKKLVVDTTREILENSVSFRHVHQKSQQQLFNDRVAKELHKAVFQDSQMMTHLNQNKMLSLHNFSEVKENLESARTEKYNRYSPELRSNVGASPKKNISLDQSPSIRKRSPYYGENEEIKQIERDKKEYALYYREFNAGLKKDHKAREHFKREWHSFDEDVMREWYDDMGPESDFNSQISHESFPHKNDKLKNAEYLARLELFRQNLKMNFMYDNVYTQLDDPSLRNIPRGNKNVTRRTQTYERDMAIGYDPFDKEIFSEDERVAAEYDPQFARDLVTRLIDNLSDFPSSNMAGESDFDYEGGRIKRKGRRVTRDNFEIDDIMGIFEIDDNGNLIIDQTMLLDNLGRKVNKNGYLIDKRGNILNQDGEVLFQFQELDNDEEIPQPYRFEVRRKQLLRQKDKQFGLTVEGAEKRRHLFDIDSVMINEDAQVEDEFNRLRKMSRASSVDSLMGNQPKEELEETRKSAAEIRASQMARAYGGQPPEKMQKKKKKRGNKRTGPILTDDRPSTDRLYPGLIQNEDQRVKKMAMIAYRQQQVPDQEDTADDVGFQMFFQKSMNEIHQNRDVAKEEFNRNQQAYLEPVVADNAFESEPTIIGDAAYNDQQPQQRQSSTSTKHNHLLNISGTGFWGQQDLKESSNGVRKAPDITVEEDKIDNDDTETVQAMGNSYFKLGKNPSSAFTTYNNLNFNYKSNSSVHHAQPIQDEQPQASAWPQFYPQGAYSQGSNNFGGPPQQQYRGDIIVSGLNLQQDQNNSVDQIETITYPKAAKPGFKKFDFYLPSNKQKNIKQKKNLQKRDLSFSEVGQMQMAATGSNKIKDLERLYLQKYPGHQQQASKVTHPQYNQYVDNTLDTTVVDQHTSLQQSKSNSTSVFQGTQGNRHNKSGLAMRGLIDKQQKGNFMGVVPERPQSSLTNMQRHNQFGRMGRLQTVNSEGADVFDGIARVLDKIERLKSSDAPRVNYYNQKDTTSDGVHETINQMEDPRYEADMSNASTIGIGGGIVHTNNNFSNSNWV